MDNLNNQQDEMYENVEGVERCRKLGVVWTLDHDKELRV